MLWRRRPDAAGLYTGKFTGDHDTGGASWSRGTEENETPAGRQFLCRPYNKQPTKKDRHSPTKTRAFICIL